MADGNTSFMWGYTLGNNAYQAPGPTMCVNQGDTVTIALKNTLAEDVSIAFPGQENVLANNVAAQPQFDSSGNLTSLTTVAPKNGGTSPTALSPSNRGPTSTRVGPILASKSKWACTGP
jgi:FtsP/CotA-like multicopper oxidase with cupredoxin domain